MRNRWVNRRLKHGVRRPNLGISGPQLGNEMSGNTNQSKMSCSCPNGHRVRGSVTLQGSRVRCPKCRTAFIFPAANSERNGSAVSDTSIMKILGDLSQTGIPVVNASDNLRACMRCGGATPKTLAVCSHCRCYIGMNSTQTDSQSPPSSMSV